MNITTKQTFQHYIKKTASKLDHSFLQKE